MHLRLLALSTILFALAACQCVSRHSTVKISTQKGQVIFNVEVARTEKEREHGLMERDSMAHDAGMIFLFEKTGEYPFWMKNTKIPLDLVFFDDQWKVVGTIENMEPMSRLSRTIGKPSRYVLEVNAGLIGQKGISVGDAATFTEVR